MLRSRALTRYVAGMSPGDEIVRCLRCAQDMVHEVSREPLAEDVLAVLLRCGACGTWRDDTFAAAQLADYDRVTAEQRRLIRDQARTLTAERTDQVMRRWAHALRHDAVRPDDFAF